MEGQRMMMGEGYGMRRKVERVWNGWGAAGKGRVEEVAAAKEDNATQRIFLKRFCRFRLTKSLFGALSGREISALRCAMWQFTEVF